MARIKKDTWKPLLENCIEFGKDKVLAVLEAYHKKCENRSAYLWGNPDTHYQAHNLDKMLLKQDETMIRLKSMSDLDIQLSLHTGLVGKHNPENYSQTLNPKSKQWVLIDKEHGEIISHSDKQFEGIKVAVNEN